MEAKPATTSSVALLRVPQWPLWFQPFGLSYSFRLLAKKLTIFFQASAASFGR